MDCFSNNITINAIRSSSPIHKKSTLSGLQKEKNTQKSVNSEKRSTLIDYLKKRLRLNKATVKLRRVLHNFKNYCFQKYLGNLSPSAVVNLSLWKTARMLTRPSQTNPHIRTTQGRGARSSTDKAIPFPAVPSYRTFYSSKVERSGSASQFQKSTGARQNN